LGKPAPPRLDKYQMKAEAAKREAAKETTATTVSQVDTLAQKAQRWRARLGCWGRRAEQRESSEEYARAYGIGVHFRNGGSIVRRPY
jgi:hypothetical protein